MCLTPLKGQAQCYKKSLPIQAAITDEKHHIDQVLHPAFRMIARQRMGMNLFGELLFAGDQLNTWAVDSANANQSRVEMIPKDI